MCNRERSKGRKFVESGIKTNARVKLQLNSCPSKSTTPVLKRIHFQYLNVNLQPWNFQDTLQDGQTMICNNNYFADILRVCEIKDLIWVMRFQSPLVYFLGLSNLSECHLILLIRFYDVFYAPFPFWRHTHKNVLGDPKALPLNLY